MTYELDTVQLAALLRERRGRRTLREVANETEISQATLSRIERDLDFIIDLRTFLAVCSWLGVHPTDFITDTDAAALMPSPSLTESAAYALAPLDTRIREALLTIIGALAAPTQRVGEG